MDDKMRKNDDDDVNIALDVKLNIMITPSKMSFKNI